MPQSLSIGCLVLGGVLLLLGLVKGRFKMFGADVPGAGGKPQRIIAALAGAALILVGLWLQLGLSGPRQDYSGSPPTPRGPDRALAIDDADSRIRYSEGGGWKTDADYHLLKSTQHYTGNPGSTATLTFNGDWIEVAYYKEPGGAIMNVDIDGKQLRQIDCGSQSGKTEYGQTQRYSDLGPGAHRLILTHTGTPSDGRRPRTFGDFTINIDGFRVSALDN
jgi:hypothetical protein